MKGYVEPSIAFWRKAVALNKQYVEVLKRFDLMTEKAESNTQSIGEMAEFLLNVSEKELAGKTLTQSEYNQIEIIGSNIEYISLQLVRVPRLVERRHGRRPQDCLHRRRLYR